MRLVTFAAVITLSAIAPLGARATPHAADSAAGHFDLDVRKSDVLRLGKSHADVVSAFAVAAPTPRGSMITIDLFTRQIDARAREQLEKSGVAAELNGAWVAMLQVALDAQHHIRQVDLQYSSPGTTVGRTVASTPGELAQWSKGFRYAGGRLHLENRGTYTSGPETPAQDFMLDWDMNLDVAVLERPATRQH